MLWISSKEEGRSTKESTRSEKGLEMGVEESLGGVVWWNAELGYGIERPQGRRSEIFIHRLPPIEGILRMPPWERVVATQDLWPDELVDDFTGWLMIYGADGQM